MLNIHNAIVQNVDPGAIVQTCDNCYNSLEFIVKIDRWGVAKW